VRAALLFLALPVAAAPLAPGTPQFSLRLEGVFGQPSTQLGVRGGGGLGLGWRLTDQLSIISDASRRPAPGGGIGALAIGLSATLDALPVLPFIELAFVDFSNHQALGYSLATRLGVGADWPFSRTMALGLVVRTYSALDPQDGNTALSGLEGALRLIYTPGAK